MKNVSEQALAALKNLQLIPGVGISIAHDLIDLGYREVSALSGEDPQLMYERICELRGAKIDRCLLYVFRLAVYFADTLQAKREPELLKWWNHSDKNLARSGRGA